MTHWGLANVRIPSRLDGKSIVSAPLSDAGGNTWRYDYDTNNRVNRKTDPRGAISQYAYDANGRATREILADGAIYRFAYVTQGNLRCEPGKVRSTEASSTR